MGKERKSNTVERFMHFIVAHAYIVLALVAAITVIFAIAMTKLSIDGNVFAYMTSVPPSEFILTPDTKPEEVLSLDGIPGTLPRPDRGEILTVPERDKSAMRAGLEENPMPFSEMSVSPSAIYHDPDDNPGYGDGYVIIFTSEEMFTPEVLNTIYEVREALSERWEIGSCLSPFDYVTVEKKGTRLSVAPIAPVKAGETWTDDDAELFRTRLMNDSVAKNYLYTEDGTTIMLYYRARGLTETAINELNSIVNPLREYGRVALNGGGLLSNAVMGYINKDLITLLVLCFAVILIVYYLSFRSMRAMFVPASLSIIGIIWTLGTMALLGYKLTIVTILTPCLVLTLASSYSIHMMSEYLEAVMRNERDSLPEHYARISKTIFYAMLTTVSGFLSFLICRTVIFREFGITISIGVTFCALLAFTYLPAILTVNKKPMSSKQEKTFRTGIMTRGINRLSDTVVDRWYIFIVLLVIIAVLFLFTHDLIGFDSNYMSYFPEDAEIVQDSLYFARTLGGTDPYYFTIRAPDGEPGFFLKHENLMNVYAYEMAIMAACPDIVQILSFSQYVSFLNEVYNGEPGIPSSDGLINLLSRVLKQIEAQIGSDVLSILINDEASEITLSMRNYDSAAGDLQTTASARRLETTLDYYRYMLPEGTESRIWCSASDSLRSVDIIMEDQTRSTYLSMVLILIFAAMAFASFPYALLSLIPIGVGVMINYIFMWAAGIPFDMVTVGFSSIAMGTGVDDTIHFMIRYRRKKREKPNLSTTALLKENLRETGRPIILTSLSIDAGLMMLIFASFRPVRYFGVLMCIALTAAMIATLCILPPTLVLVDKISTRIRKH